MKTVSLETTLTELQSLRREVALFLPTESIEDFSNKKEILVALKNAEG